MTLARWQRTVVNTSGVPVAGASVRVEIETTGLPLATLYSDREGTTPIANPTTTDADGLVGFYCAGNAHKITITGNDVMHTLRYEPIGLAQEKDGITAGVSFFFSTGTIETDPGTGFIAFNNSTLASVTKILVSGSDRYNQDVQAFLATISDGTVYIRNATGSGFLIVSVTGSASDQGDHFEIPVTITDSGGTFFAGEDVGLLPAGGADGADGTNGTDGADGTNGTDGADGTDGVNAGITFTFDTDTTTSADPGTGDVRFNNATLSSVTEVAIDDNSAESGNPDISAYIATFDNSTNTIKGQLLVKVVANPEIFALYDVTARTDATTHNRLTVTHLASSGTFGNGDTITVEFFRVGDKGADGAGAGDVVGPGADTVIDGQIAVFNGTTGAAIEGGLDPNGSPQDPITANTLLLKGGGFSETTSLLLAVDGDGKIRTTNNPRFGSIGIIVDGGGSAITTGVKGYLRVPFDCSIVGAYLLADQTGSAVVDIWVDAFANFPPTDADSITAAAQPTISSGVSDSDETLTGWTVALSEGDVIGFNIDSVSTIERLTIDLRIRKNSTAFTP